MALSGRHPLNRLDGVWRLLMVVGWTANITLMVNLAAKFLSGVGGDRRAAEYFGVASGGE
jgi:hypothetical protein